MRITESYTKGSPSERTMKWSESMLICENPVSRDDLRQMAATGFGDMVKGVVDIDRELLAVDAELHADLEAFLLNHGSSQNSLWGINLYPDEDEDFVEFDSLINIRPMSGNRSRGVDDSKIRERILEVVLKWTEP